MLVKKQAAILFITMRADWGGGPEHLWRLLQNLAPEFKAYIACPDEEPYYQRYASIIGEERIFKVPHRTFSLPHLIRLHKWCVKNKISLIHSHGKGAGLYGRLLALISGLPCVHTPHGVHLGAMPVWKQKIYLFYEYIMSCLSAAVISVSQGELDQIKSLKFSPAKRLQLIPNGVVIPEQPIEQAVNGPYSVIHISRFDVQKNSEALIPILKELSTRGRLTDFHFKLIGNGTEQKNIEDKIQQLGFSKHVTFYGFTPEPQKHFNKALCFLSTSRWEGLPLAVLEAMSHGLVPVVTDVVGNRDAVKNGQTGLLYSLDSAVEACDKLIELADNSKLRGELAKNARQDVVLNYNVTLCANATCDIYRKILIKL